MANLSEQLIAPDFKKALQFPGLMLLFISERFAATALSDCPTQRSSSLISTTDSLTYSTCAGTSPLVTSLLSGILAKSTTSVGDSSMGLAKYVFNIRLVTNRNNRYWCTIFFRSWLYIVRLGLKALI